MDEEGFRKFLRRSGRSQSAIRRCVAVVREFETYLRTRHDGKKLDEASPADLEAFALWVEDERGRSAKTHLWGIRYYYDFASKEVLKESASDLREQRIKRTPFALKGFRRVNREHLEKLDALGIRDVEQMRVAGSTPSGRQKLSVRAGIPPNSILELVKLSDLARIPGLKAIRARLYYDAGVDTIEKLAEWDPSKLRAMLISFVEKTGFDGIAPLPKEAESAVAAARRLKRVIRY